MQSNTRVYLYVLQLTGVIAIILALLFNSLNPMFKKNKEVAKKLRNLADKIDKN